MSADGLPDSELLTIYRQIEERFSIFGLNSQTRGMGDRVLALAFERFIEIKLGTAIPHHEWLQALMVKLKEAQR